MDNILSALYFISVGVLLTTALHAALLAPGSSYQRECWTFAAICLAFALFQLCSALQYMAAERTAAIATHKWVNFFSLLLIPLIAYLVASLEKKHMHWTVYLIAGLAAAMIVYNFAAPFGYRFASLHERGITTLPWGEQAHILSGEPSAGFQLVRWLSLGLTAYIILFSAKVGKLGEHRFKFLIWSAIALMIITSSFAGLSDAGVLSMPYLGGFGFLFLAGIFSLLVRTDFSNREQEALRVTTALEREMRGHQLTNQRFQHALYVDPLTELPNRAGSVTGLDKLFAQNDRSDTKVAVFLFDLDRLGVINGARGQKAGDQLLVEVAQRLRHSVREADLLAKLGGGSFMVGAGDLKDQACVNGLYEKLSRTLAAPFDVSGNTLQLSFSAGVAVYPDDADTAEDLLATAELALHDAKGSGPGNLRTFDAALKDTIQERLVFEGALNDALAKNQFFLCYQPQVLSASGRTVCLEALIRWQHPGYGLVMPDRFIVLAESMGIISAIGSWVIDEACGQLARWHAMGLKHLKVAINLSAHQLLTPDLEDIVTGALRRHGLASGDIELEITESALIADPELAVERLTALRKLGIRLSIDDFGTGYSSLSYLRLLPVHAFKLDRSFVRDIGKGGKDLEICATALRLANNLGLDVVAEGVETPAQMLQLQSLGCHLLQGYLFSRPLTVEAANAYLLASSPFGAHAATTDETTLREKAPST